MGFINAGHKLKAKMTGRGYTNLTHQVAQKGQDIILPCTSLGPGKFILVFFQTDMASRLRVEAVRVFDQEGVELKFSRRVTSCRWACDEAASISVEYQDSKRHHIAQVKLPESVASCVFGVYYKAAAAGTSPFPSSGTNGTTSLSRSWLSPYTAALGILMRQEAAAQELTSPDPHLTQSASNHGQSSASIRTPVAEELDILRSFQTVRAPCVTGNVATASSSYNNLDAGDQNLAAQAFLPASNLHHRPPHDLTSRAPAEQAQITSLNHFDLQTHSPTTARAVNVTPASTAQNSPGNYRNDLTYSPSGQRATQFATQPETWYTFADSGNQTELQDASRTPTAIAQGYHSSNIVTSPPVGLSNFVPPTPTPTSTGSPLSGAVSNASSSAVNIPDVCVSTPSGGSDISCDYYYPLM